jgi:hypothetical protein
MLFSKIFFISFIFISTAKFENEAFSTYEFHFQPNLPTVELVFLPEINYNLQDVKKFAAIKQLSLTNNPFHFSAFKINCDLFNLAHDCYTSLLLTPSQTDVPQNFVTPFLHKITPWHSSEDDPFPGDRC